MPKLKALIIGLIGLILVVGSGGAWYAWTVFQPVSKDTAKTRFVIPKGQAVSVIANRLTEQNLIRHPWVFRLHVKQANLENKLQAGSYELAPSMTVSEIAAVLTSGSDDIWITIPEGWRKEEIAQSLAGQELDQFDEEEFLELAAASEGTLFPDSYLVSRDSTASALYNLLTSTFDQKVVKGLASEVAASGKSLDDLLIMASLIEREANGFEQMRHISGILWNRIEIGMPLQVDATMQYAKGYDQTQKSWWSPPLAADRQIVSPFNTYQQPGLPPRPIANPGLDAIKAAADPLEVSDLFYIHDNQGKMHYAKTLEEHNANVEKYLR